MKKPFLTTAFGGWVKVFMSAVLLQMLNSLTEGHTLFSWDIEMVKKFVNAGVISLIPVLINYFNPQYPLYGPKPKTSKVTDEATGQTIEP